MMKILFILLFTLTLNANIQNSRSFNQIIHDNKIDITNKSLKSWIRFFNSPENISENSYNITEGERLVILKKLKSKLKRKKRSYTRGIK
ncbi:MAG: hypothetical protein U9N42_07265 [Campylobacterota bacterium]|nr:hypothetical protein [Campylobacterota bacterium]